MCPLVGDRFLMYLELTTAVILLETCFFTIFTFTLLMLVVIMAARGVYFILFCQLELNLWFSFFFWAWN